MVGLLVARAWQALLPSHAPDDAGSRESNALDLSWLQAQAAVLPEAHLLLRQRADCRADRPPRSSSPATPTGLDFELELAWVLEAPLYHAPTSDALDAIGGFLLLNDFSARDVRRAEVGSGLGPRKARHFITPCRRRP